MQKDSNSFYVLLGLLDSGAKSGYDIKKTIEYEIGHYFKISNGQIYPTLKKLEDRQYATFTVEKNDGKPDRKVYLITEKGRSIFKEWLGMPVDYHNPDGNELLLKLYFGSQATAEDNMRLITAFKELKTATLEVYDESGKYFKQSTFSNLQDRYSYITLRYGQMLAQANIDWCNEAIDMIKKAEEKP
jgi:PadR family transcriptional regulator, regulatory protein AphA